MTVIMMQAHRAGSQSRAMTQPSTTGALSVTVRAPSSESVTCFLVPLMPLSMSTQIDNYCFRFPEMFCGLVALSTLSSDYSSL